MNGTAYWKLSCGDCGGGSVSEHALLGGGAAVGVGCHHDVQAAERAVALHALQVVVAHALHLLACAFRTPI